jgi:circadian clock protein KaiC
MELQVKTGKNSLKTEALSKSATGIAGLDELMGGGLPRGRTTLVSGSAGCGKTLLAMEFLVHGIKQFDEPGVFMSFEESSDELNQNVASLGFDLQRLIARKKLYVDWVQVNRNEIEETGEYDLDGLFVRLVYAIDSVGAKRVVLDTIEALFGELPNPAVLRAEVRRLFRFLKDRGVTAIVTGERDRPDRLTRHSLEEFVSDCVILLDHRVVDEISTRRLRIVKYRGSHHGTNEYPFLIDEGGISVIPLSSLKLDHPAGTERVSTGVRRLDDMIGGKGYYVGSSVLISGTAGSGKSTLAASFADATCKRGERCIFFAFEESEQQIMRNMRAVGIDLQAHVRRDLLRFHASRPTGGGVEEYLTTAIRLTNEFQPSAVVFDPVTNLTNAGSSLSAQSALTRLLDFFKNRGVTCLFTSLTAGEEALEATAVGISSLMDTWLVLKMIEIGGELNRVLQMLKARGLAHSNQVREFIITSHGIHLEDVYLGQDGVLTGTSRMAQQMRDDAATLVRRQELDQARLNLARRREIFEVQNRKLAAEFKGEEESILRDINRLETLEQQATDGAGIMGERREYGGAEKSRNFKNSKRLGKK